MKKRIGNDIHFVWHIYRKDGESQVPESFTGKDVEVKLISPLQRPVTIENVSIATGVVTFTFRGKHQVTLGNYVAVLLENKGEDGMVTLDVVNAVTLVPHSYMEEDGDEGDVIEAEAVELESSISAGGGGGIEQQQADWAQTDDTAVDFIKNKPNLDVYCRKDADNTHSDGVRDIFAKLVYDEHNPSVLVQADRLTVGGDSIKFFHSHRGEESKELSLQLDDVEKIKRTATSELDGLMSAEDKQKLTDIEAVIPEQASSSNKLVDEDSMNSSIATATATFRGAFNLVTDLHLSVSATHAQIATALATTVQTADNNDYCYVQIPVADATPTEFASVERYKYNGNAWEYEYTLNNSGFTAAQWAAINSYITSGLVTKLSALPTNEQLTDEMDGKADTADLAPVATSGSYNDLSDKPDLSGFITNSVDNLVNYYLKSETYTKAEVQQLIGAIQQFHYEVYPTLPQTGASNVLYLIGPTGTGTDKYEEYVYANNTWTKIGDTSIDLSGYVTTEALTTALADYVTSSALSVILANYVNKNEIDDVPTANSKNLVTSGGVYNALQGEYVVVTATAQTTAVTDLLPTTGNAGTIYRVGNWDGTQYNDSVFSEYAWNGSAYIKLSTKSQVGEVYDISANHADTKYSDLAAALGANGANIPQSLRKGGMSIKFVQSSDNKYVQYRLMSNAFSTTESDWQGVDDEPTAGSDNLVKSKGIELTTRGLNKVEHIEDNTTFTKEIAIKSGGQNIKIDYNFRKGVQYKITLSSDTSNTGKLSVILMSNPEQYIAFGLWHDLSQSPYSALFIADNYAASIIVNIRTVATAGTLTAVISCNDYNFIDRNVALKKIGKNLCNPEKLVGGCVESDRIYFSDTGIAGMKVTDWIPIKAGQTLCCNVKPSDRYKRNGLFANYGDTIPIKTETYTSSEYSKITNDTENDCYAVFSVPPSVDVIISASTIPLNYTPYSEIGGYTEDLRDFSDYGSIAANYPEEVADEIDILSQGTAVRFVHISDTHADGAAKFAYDFTDASSADFFVHTGDIISDFNKDFDETLALALAHTKPTFFVIGNHDTLYSGTTQAVFEKFIAPLNDHNGLTGNTKTYYSKDFATAKVKCIFMNDYDGDASTEQNPGYSKSGNMTDAQITWFINQMKDALTNGYAVAIFIHQYPSKIANFKDEWTDALTSDNTVYTEFIPVIVDAFMRGVAFTTTNPVTGTEFTDTFSKKGMFAGYFCGHTHADQVGTLADYPAQKVNVISRANMSDSTDGCIRIPDLSRANYVSIDKTRGLVCVYRLGSQKMRCGGLRKSYQYSFLN